MSDTRNRNINTEVENIINNINDSINAFMYENNIDNLIEVSSSIYNACLMYIHKNTFNNGLLKNNIISNEYDYMLVSYICDYYIYMCYQYNKYPSILGFQYMTGIDDNTIHRTGSGIIASSKNWDIKQKILKASENSLESGLFDGSGNPVGKIAILNHRFNWATTAAAHGIEKQAKTADQLPNFRQFAQIENEDKQGGN